MKTGVELIADERKRQIEVENWTPEHDDEHDGCELALAGACYAIPENSRTFPHVIKCYWPFSSEWWKPTPNDRIHELVKAGALIAAEIDRLQRLKGATDEPTEV